MKYVFELNNNYKNFDIVLSENKEIIYDNSTFIEYNILYTKMRNLENKKYYNLYIKTRLVNKTVSNKLYKNLKNDDDININIDKIINNKFDINEYSYFIVNNDNSLNYYYILKENKNIDKNIKKIYKNLFLTNTRNFYNNYKSPSEKELYSHKNIIIFLYNLFDILEENGNILLTIYNFTNYKTYLIILLISCFFKIQIIL